MLNDVLFLPSVNFKHESEENLHVWYVYRRISLNPQWNFWLNLEMFSTQYHHILKTNLHYHSYFRSNPKIYFFQQICLICLSTFHKKAFVILNRIHPKRNKRNDEGNSYMKSKEFSPTREIFVCKVIWAFINVKDVKDRFVALFIAKIFLFSYL